MRSDASKDGIGTAIYQRQINDKGQICMVLVFGQSRVAPAQTTSIPCLELCAAVLAAQAVNKITKEIDVDVDIILYRLQSCPGIYSE